MTHERQLLLKKARELELLVSASRTLNTNVEFGELLKSLLKIVKTATRAEYVLLAALDLRDRMVFERALGIADADVRGMPIVKGTGVMGHVWRKGQPVIIDDMRHSDLTPVIAKKLGIKVHSLVAIPLKRRGLVRGVLQVVNRRNEDAFTPDDLTLLSALGEHVAAAVANARLRESAQRRRLEYQLLAEVSADVGKSLTRDEALDRILKNLQRLVESDAAAIFLVDGKTSTISSVLHTGYPRTAQEKIQIHLDEGIVGVVAKTKNGLIVPDVRAHAQYANVRARTRSEMVAPMILRGQVLGLFNVESDRLDAYSEDDLRLLEAFAAEAAVAIDRAHLFEERKVKLEIEEELRLARTVQEFFSPKKSLVTANFRIAGANFPSLEVSGDYYDFFPAMNRLVAFAIADVAGKGVPASLIMASFRSTFRTVAPFTASARQMVLRLNQILMDTVRPQDFVTTFVGVLNPDTGELSYCNAGHNPPIVLAADGSFRRLEVGGPVLGILKDTEVEWHEGRMRLHSDEALVCYTDGATEATNGEEEYGEARFIEAVRANVSLTPYRLCTALYANMRAFIGATPQVDDTTYLAIKRMERAPSGSGGA
ncbi:MAG TPA: SpoIIE family protein phosphatase [Candidatus Krumholzibacteria bacterium]|nr:SpoIIE family protein phosphatase [Candidatus Krumholzibacteria bacterium]